MQSIKSYFEMKGRYKQKNMFSNQRINKSLQNKRYLKKK